MTPPLIRFEQVALHKLLLVDNSGASHDLVGKRGARFQRKLRCSKRKREL
jgi:hypothetical protein